MKEVNSHLPGYQVLLEIVNDDPITARIKEKEIGYYHLESDPSSCKTVVFNFADFHARVNTQNYRHYETVKVHSFSREMVETTRVDLEV